MAKKSLVIILVYFITVILIYFLFQPEEKPPEWTALNALKLSSPSHLNKDQDLDPLIRSIDLSIKYYDKLANNTTFQFGPDQFNTDQVRNSLKDFKEQLSRHGFSPAFFDYLKTNFHFYQSQAKDVLFTGYYEASLKGSTKKTKIYKYPLYRKPDDLYRIDLSKFYFFKKVKGLPRFLKVRISEEKAILPFFSRREIDEQSTLTGKDMEIVWIDNPIDVFFLQIQGSGIVQLDSGETIRVNYAESNGHQYRAIGKYLIDEGHLTLENVSMQSIRNYLQKNPQKMTEVFNYNPSYVFFRTVNEGPLGSIQVPLTPFRSIATDSRLFPKGSLCFIETKIPVFDEQQKIIEWNKFSAFVLNQDTGGAIKGAGRVDLFCGYGPQAELVAGHMKQQGKLYFLIKKDSLLK